VRRLAVAYQLIIHERSDARRGRETPPGNRSIDRSIVEDALLGQAEREDAAAALEARRTSIRARYRRRVARERGLASIARGPARAISLAPRVGPAREGMRG
jgi:hypothetical protein